MNDAKSGKTHYEHQEDSERTIIVFGDTAVITAKLWGKGVEDGEKVDYKEWFSDVYVRTPKGWRYFLPKVHYHFRTTPSTERDSPARLGIRATHLGR